MKKTLLILSLATIVALSPFFTNFNAEAETNSGKEKSYPIELDLVKKTDKKNVTIQSRYTFEPHQFTKEEMEKIKNAPEGTSVGSDGSIVYPEEQLKAIKEKGTKLSGSYGKLGKPTSDDISILTFTEVTDRNEYPYRAIAEIEIDNGEKDHRCTGFFVDSNTVVTAAHCVYDTNANRYYGEATVYPFYQENLPDVIGYITSDFKISTSWITVEPDEYGYIRESDFARDYAVINLLPENQPAQEFGWFAIRDYDHEVGEGLNVSGFPASKQTHPIDWSYDLYKSLGKVTGLDTYLIKHSAEIENGDSGAPAFNEKEGTLAVIGVNNARTIGYSDRNLAARIIGYTYNNIVYWSGLN